MAARAERAEIPPPMQHRGHEAIDNNIVRLSQPSSALAAENDCCSSPNLRFPGKYHHNMLTCSGVVAELYLIEVRD